MAQALTTTPLDQARSRGGEVSVIAFLSLVVGPLIMAVGDLIHPRESADVDQQVAIVMDHAQRWYQAHLLLFVGFILFIPGLLGLTAACAARWPRTGHLARGLIAIGVAGMSAIFVMEMVAGRLAMVGPETTTDLLRTLFSAQVGIPVFVAAIGFFAGSILLALRVISGARHMRWPASILLVGLLCIIAEIASSQVVLSQVGNVLVWIGSVGLARRLRSGWNAPLSASPR